MNPIDFSKQTFADLQPLLDQRRAEVHAAWLAHGPTTTAGLAEAAGIPILTLRPRSTELYQLGLLELVGNEGHSGIYRARTLAGWEAYVTEQRRLAITGQLALKV